MHCPVYWMGLNGSIPLLWAPKCSIAQCFGTLSADRFWFNLVANVEPNACKQRRYSNIWKCTKDYAQKCSQIFRLGSCIWLTKKTFSNNCYIGQFRVQKLTLWQRQFESNFLNVSKIDEKFKVFHELKPFKVSILCNAELSDNWTLTISWCQNYILGLQSKNCTPKSQINQQ